MWNSETLEAYLKNWYMLMEAGALDSSEPTVTRHPDYPDIILFVEFADRTLVNEEADEEIWAARSAEYDELRLRRMWDE